MQDFNYWEREFIRRGGEELRMKAFTAQLETIKRVHGDKAYEEAILSEKPLSELGYLPHIEPPRITPMMHIEYP